MNLGNRIQKAKLWFQKKYLALGEEDAEDFSQYFGEYILKTDLAEEHDSYHRRKRAIDFLRKHKKRKDHRGGTDAMNVAFFPEDENELLNIPMPDHPREVPIHRKATLEHRVVLFLVYEYELDMRDIAKILGVSAGRVSQLHTEILELQRKEFYPTREKPEKRRVVPSLYRR